MAQRIEPVRVVFDGPPGPESGRFVEVEVISDGRGVGKALAGTWTRDLRADWWNLGPLLKAPETQEDVTRLLAYVERLCEEKGWDYDHLALAPGDDEAGE